MEQFQNGKFQNGIVPKWKFQIGKFQIGKFQNGIVPKWNTRLNFSIPYSLLDYNFFNIKIISI